MRNLLNGVLLAAISICLCSAESLYRTHPLRTQRMHPRRQRATFEQRQQHAMYPQRQHRQQVSNANQLSAERNLFDEYEGYNVDEEYANEYGQFDAQDEYQQDEYEQEDFFEENDFNDYDEEDFVEDWYQQDYYDDDPNSAHVVISKEGPPPAPQEYTISKLEEPVVCADKGDETWKKWKKYDLDGVCSRLQYYGEIEGRCETDCDALCPNGFYEVAKEPCTDTSHFTVHTDTGTQHHTVHSQNGYYRQCVGRYHCTHSQYNYWVNMKWWQFLLWEIAIVIIGCCFCGLAIGCCLRCTYSDRQSWSWNSQAGNPQPAGAAVRSGGPNQPPAGGNAPQSNLSVRGRGRGRGRGGNRGRGRGGQGQNNASLSPQPY